VLFADVRLPAPGEHADATLSGQVVNEAGGAVGGASVTLMETPGGNATSAFDPTTNACTLYVLDGQIVGQDDYAPRLLPPTQVIGIDETRRCVSAYCLGKDHSPSGLRALIAVARPFSTTNSYV
jgi:hypothetical protein